MKSIIRTEAGVMNVTNEATVGKVTINGADVLPHEAFLIGAELQRAARAANLSAVQYADETIKTLAEAA